MMVVCGPQIELSCKAKGLIDPIMRHMKTQSVKYLLCKPEVPAVLRTQEYVFVIPVLGNHPGQLGLAPHQ